MDSRDGSGTADPMPDDCAPTASVNGPACSFVAKEGIYA